MLLLFVILSLSFNCSLKYCPFWSVWSSISLRYSVVLVRPIFLSRGKCKVLAQIRAISLQNVGASVRTDVFEDGHHFLFKRELRTIRFEEHKSLEEGGLGNMPKFCRMMQTNESISRECWGLAIGVNLLSMELNPQLWAGCFRPIKYWSMMGLAKCEVCALCWS